MEETFDFTQDTPETLDFFRPVPGWYLATLRDVKLDDREGFLMFRFRVDGPQLKGATLTQKLDNPRYCPNPQWLEMRQRQWKVWADRVIFDGKAPCGQQAKGSFDSAVGKQFVINVKDGSYPDKVTGILKEKVELDYAPYPMDHEGIPVPVRKALGLALLPGQVEPVEGLPKSPTKRKAAGAAAQPAAAAAPPTDAAVDNVMGTLGL